MLSIERLLVLVEQYIITVEVRMLFSRNHTCEITYRGFFGINDPECEYQVYEGRGVEIIHPSSPHPFAF